MIRKTCTLHSLLPAIKCLMEHASPETKKHGDRVKRISVLVGQSLGMNHEELEILALLGSFHDIGKIVVPNHILMKKDLLTPEELSLIRAHPVIGFELAKSVTELAPVAHSILFHHERWDGEGYPCGVAGENIPLMARIISIADAFDAMTEKRPYRKIVSISEALRELRCCSGTQFDPSLVPIFESTILGSKFRTADFHAKTFCS